MFKKSTLIFPLCDGIKVLRSMHSLSMAWRTRTAMVVMSSSGRFSGPGMAPRSVTSSSSPLGRRLAMTAMHGNSSTICGGSLRHYCWPKTAKGQGALRVLGLALCHVRSKVLGLALCHTTEKGASKGSFSEMQLILQR